MSNQVEDETRLHQCAKKYEKIVKQFDELIEIMNSRNCQPKQQRGSRGNSSTVAASQPEENEVVVQTITKFLHELKTNPTDPECSTST
ncbi:hypothetical protein I3760_09G174600 [Carya illinoinensis]|uniref:Uncharacterized protein n=1 Tax=Carya illinoinensis TaxID=32201 RepID=A0A922J857_CARIL|nr:hypothetical protein I3760_09G174600 [Carya illinoinensis]KAG6696998.1 hypothetical protein I3842_09G177200 [Carya illinoinensis]